MMRNRLAATVSFALAVALALAYSGPATADQKPVPPPSAATSAGPNLSKVLTVAQVPDLVVSFEGVGPGLPTGFTVKNVGNGDSKPSILKVSATLVPPEASSGGAGACPPYISPEQCAAMLAFAAIFGGQGGGTSSATVEKMKTACGLPFPEFLEIVPVLKPGESKTFKRDSGPHHVAIAGVFAQPALLQITHIKPCSPTLVCAWDVKAVADASNDNDERIETNNTSTRRALREVSFK